MCRHTTNECNPRQLYTIIIERRRRYAPDHLLFICSMGQTMLAVDLSIVRCTNFRTILEHKTPRAYTKTYVGIVRIGVRISRLAILTTKYTLHTSIPCHVYNSLTLKVFCTAFDANTSLYDSDTCSTVQKQLLHSLNLPRKRARRARSARLVYLVSRGIF